MFRVQTLRLLDEVIDDPARREMLFANPFVGIHLQAVDLIALFQRCAAVKQMTHSRSLLEFL